MYSTVSDDFSGENLARRAAEFVGSFAESTRNITAVHKELLEINLSFTAYIEESRRRLDEIRLRLAHDAKSSQKVVEVLSEKSSPRKRNNKNLIKSQFEDNNNTNNKFSERQQAFTFVQWYKGMIDNDRMSLGLYLSDDATLEWFGRTIKTRKKISSFLKYDMQCSKHDFTSVDCIEKISTRQDRPSRTEDAILASPLHSPELIKTKVTTKRKLRSNCNSPEWAEGCAPDEEYETSKKRTKSKAGKNETKLEVPLICSKPDYSSDETLEIGNKGDGMGRRKRKCIATTPPNREVGQGDCIPSTSGTDSNKSHDALNAQLPRLAVECNGYIQFSRTRNNRSTDAMKWDRKCKVQVSYSEDPLNVGEYIIWALRYTDDSKCRRNLLAAFEEVAKDEMKHV